jgi:hypothetical protein
MTTPHIQHQAEKLAKQATIAIVTALPAERVAMEAMLEDPIPLWTVGNASGEYWVGTMSGTVASGAVKGNRDDDDCSQQV